ncbi:MAG: sigma 54-interacting transcriptional regulator [Acidobacteriaceae bacterium]|nr:sigma 54-interacting transcriptional regulator [Acidobacteriaceae bacterium]
MKDADLIGSSAKFRTVLDEVNMVAPADCAVLIQGETGTGKEVVARAIHDGSPRRQNRFVALNCAAIPSALLESELFGHERGAFTGAVTQTAGRFQAAERGTLFLDEIGDLPLELQPKLLRVLQEKQIERLGGSRTLQVDVRVIAATNQDLWQMVQERKFRADLYYRLNVFPIKLPPLRDRKEDLPLLLDYFIGRYASKIGKNIKHVDKSTMGLLNMYDWPGNIRELQNIVERAVIFAETDTLFVDKRWLRCTSAESSTARDGLSALAEDEAAIIESALAQSNGRISGPLGAAAKLRIPRQTLESKIRRLGINKYGLEMRLTASTPSFETAAVGA